MALDGIIIWLVGALVALALGLLEARRARLPAGRVIAGFALLGPALFLGARAHSMLLEEGRSAADLLQIGTWVGRGTRLPGGWILSAFASPFVARALRLSAPQFCDIAAVAGTALLAIGRLACHITGCCVGVPTSLPWAITYGPGTVAYNSHLVRGWIQSDALQSMPVHPFGLYMSLVAGGTLSLLLCIDATGARPGSRALWSVILLGLGFAAIEGLRDVIGSRPPLLRGEMWLAFGLAGMAVATLRLVVRSSQRESSGLAVRAR